MNREEFKEAVIKAVEQYIADEECYDDNAQLTVNPETHEVALADGDDDLPDELDQYSVMDLVQMDADGRWQVDMEAVEALCDEE